MQVDLEFDFDKTTSAMDIFSITDFNELRQWTRNLDKSKFVPKDLTDKQLVLFYNACYGDLNNTKLCIEKYYKHRKNSPEFFDNRIMDAEELKSTIEATEVCVLPGKSCEGYEIIYHNFNNADPLKFNLVSIFKLILMTIDLCLIKRGPQSGYLFLFDLKGFKFSHFTKVSLMTVRKYNQYVQEALPIRLKAVHILNAPLIMDSVMSLIKPFMDKKYYEMAKFHSKTEDLEKLYEIVPRTSLPSNYGGTLPDSQTLHKESIEQLRMLEPYFAAEEAQRCAAFSGY